MIEPERTPEGTALHGWAKVLRQLAKARQTCESAQDEEEFQTVGTICREALISLAQEVHDPAKHPPLDGKECSDTDAARRLEATIAVELARGGNEDARRHARAALSLANALQHRRTADYKMAAFCVEATDAVIRLMAILLDQRTILRKVPSPVPLSPLGQGLESECRAALNWLFEAKRELSRLQLRLNGRGSILNSSHSILNPLPTFSFWPKRDRVFESIERLEDLARRVNRETFLTHLMLGSFIAEIGPIEKTLMADVEKLAQEHGFPVPT